jgi:hypothetical protein
MEYAASGLADASALEHGADDADIRSEPARFQTKCTLCTLFFEAVFGVVSDQLDELDSVFCVDRLKIATPGRRRDLPLAFPRVRRDPKRRYSSGNEKRESDGKDLR